jgi:hypothetical protein
MLLDVKILLIKLFCSVIEEAVEKERSICMNDAGFIYSP